jgi:Acetyltransferases
MSNDIVIRPATADDAEVVYGFICELSHTSFDKEVFERIFVENLSHTLYHYYVAEDEGKVTGFLSCHGQYLLHHNGLAYELQEMYVDEAYRSHGVGKMMLDVLLNKIGGTYDVLEVTSNNMRKDAHRFYLNNGFLQTHLKFTRK